MPPMPLPGPYQAGQAHASSSLPSERRDQTIFLNYYKMKRRFWKGIPMRAAADGAGLHDYEWDAEDDPDRGSLSYIVDDTEFDIQNEGYPKAKKVRVLPAISAIAFVS